MEDLSRHISDRDLRSAWDFLWECLRAEQTKPKSPVTGRLVKLVWDHTKRVVMWTETLCVMEGLILPQYTLMAAILHDCAKLNHGFPSGFNPNDAHISVGKKLTLKFLTEELGKDPKLAHDIALMVGSHNFGIHKIAKLDPPKQLTEKIVHDANLLDYMDVWGLLLTAEYNFQRKVEGGKIGWDPGAILYIAEQQALRLRHELTLDSAKKIADASPNPDASQKRGLLQRLTRGYKYLHSLNDLKTINDFRRAFADFLKSEDPELQLTLKRFERLGLKPDHIFI